jgi:hypothetical protein
MKKFTLSSIIVLMAISFGAYAMEDKDLCAAHIQKIQDTVASPGNMSPKTISLTKQRLDEAKAAQSAGNDKLCIDVTVQTLFKLRQYLK